jgi:hypothetical protein
MRVSWVTAPPGNASIRGALAALLALERDLLVVGKAAAYPAWQQGWI